MQTVIGPRSNADVSQQPELSKMVLVAALIAVLATELNKVGTSATQLIA